MNGFFRSKAPAPQTVTRAEGDPAQVAGQKPTGQFSPKRILVGITVCVALVLLFIVSTGQRTAPKDKSQQKQTQDTAAATSAASAAAGKRDYSTAVSQAIRPILPDQPLGQAPAQAAGQYQYPSIQLPPGTLPSPQSTNPYAGYPYPTSSSTAPTYAPSSPSPVPGGSTSAQQRPRDPQQDARDAMQVDDDKREHDSLAAGLIVRSERVRPPTGSASTSASTSTPGTPAPASTAPTTTTAAPPAGDPRALGSPLPASPPAGPTPSPDRATRARGQSALNRASGPAYKLFEGTIVETVLTNRLNSSFTGPVECMVTIDVWSQSRQHILIPKGTKVLGEARRLTQQGQSRLAVIFHRLIMPDGFSVSLDQFTGLNQIGETGLKDKVNNHYAQIFGASLALGAISGLAIAGTHNTMTGAAATGQDAMRQGFAQQLSQEGTQILDRFTNVLPTVTIREGVRVKVYLTDDLSLPAYDQHRMPTDL